MRHLSITSFIAGFSVACFFAILIFVFETRQYEVPVPDADIPAGFVFRGIGTSECVNVTDSEVNIPIFRFHCGYPISIKEIRRVGRNEWQVRLQRAQ